MRRALVVMVLVVLMTVGAGARAIDVATADTGGSVVQQDVPTADTGQDSSPPYLMIILTTVFVAGGCLYLLFRRGSIAYRARSDEEDGTSHGS